MCTRRIRQILFCLLAVGGLLATALTVPSSAVTPAPATPQHATPNAIAVAVVDASGGPVAGVQVDLFTADSHGNRDHYLKSRRTDHDGKVSFDLHPGHYVITIIAPPGETFDGSQWFQQVVKLHPDDRANITAQLDEKQPAPLSISGSITFADGTPAQATVDLFQSAGDGERDSYLSSATSGPDGTYQFEVAAACYVLTFIAPAGEKFNGTRWYQTEVCVEPGRSAEDVDAVLDAKPDELTTGLSGTVTEGSGDPAVGVEVTRWAVGGDGARTDYLGSEDTGADGRYTFEVNPGCYWLIYVAPPGQTFNGSPWLERLACVDPGQFLDGLDAMLDGGGDPTEVSVSVGDASVIEGAAGDATPVAVTLTLSSAAAQTVSVTVAISGGTATDGVDFTGSGGVVRFSPGETTGGVTLTVIGDDNDEDNETIEVTLSDPSTGLTIDDGAGVVTIIDDDGEPGDAPGIADQEFSVEELSPAGTAIGAIVAEGNGSPVTFSLDDSSIVALDAATGELRVVDPLALVADTTITVQVTATNGGGSNSATVTIAVRRVDTLPNPNSGPTNDGGTLEVEITTPADRTAIAGGPLTIEGLAGIDGTAGAASVTYVVDVSGSTTSGGNDCNGDGEVNEGDNFNGDSRFGTVLDCEIAGVLALNRSLANRAVEVSLVVFSTSARIVDVTPGPNDGSFTTPTADLDGNGVADIEEALASLGSGGGTNFARALTATATVQAERSAGRNGFAFFLSDGRSTSSIGAIVQQLADDGVQVNTYSIGASGLGCDPAQRLRQIADGTGGTCAEVTDPSNLSAELTGAPQDLESVVVSIDGGPAVEASINALGQWSVEVPEVSVDRHVIRATARAADGTELAAEILVIRLR